ncbi:MAG: hypothetical protein K0U41_03860 [Gammaproteobacteria bacterium]|nr:hypothetical protein [Gammaproteobacteria bacterium]
MITIFNKAKNKRAIYFDELANALNCMASPPDLGGVVLFKYKYNSPNEYTEKLQDFINNKELRDHISIDKEPMEIKYLGPIKFKYKIVVKNLKIILRGFHPTFLCLMPAPYLNQDNLISSSALVLSTSDVGIYFQNNIFTLQKDNFILSNNHCLSQEITVFFMGRICLNFEGNEFKNIDCSFELLEGVHDFTKEYQFHRLIILQMVEGDMDDVINMGGHLVTSPRIILRHKSTIDLGKVVDIWGSWFYDLVDNKKQQEGAITKEDTIDKGVINLRAEDVAVINQSHVIIRNNKINMMSISLPMKVTFDGKNRINCISIGGKENFDPFFKSDSHSQNDFGFDIFWGPYNKIDKKGSHVKENIEFFLYLKNRAIVNKDKSQEIIINRELTKCDAHLIKNEIFRESFQDKLILWFGGVVSDHGVSLIRPFLWLLFLNALATAFVVLPFHEQLLNWTSIGYIFIETLNPISSIGSSIEETLVEETIEGAGKLWVSLINALQKLGFALMAYEFIRVGRRFTTK